MNTLRAFLSRLWPKRLMGQTVLLVLMALLCAQIVSALIVRSEARSFFRGAEIRFLAERVAPYATLMQDTPAARRTQLATALSNRRFNIWISDDAAVSAVLPADGKDEDDDRWPARDLAARIAAEMGNRRAEHIRVYHKGAEGEHDQHRAMARLAHSYMNDERLSKQVRHSDTVVSVALEDGGQWMNAALITRPPRQLIRADAWITFILAAAAISLIVVFALRRITRPLGALSEAASKLGRGEEVAPLNEEGPADVKDAIHAFNEMQDRLRKFIGERTKMLAAVSHDLRTPITALRLRAEMLDDTEAGERMIQTLTEMQDMIEATLTFTREEFSDEPTSPCDLGALLGTIAADLQTVGYDVSLTVPHPVTYPCRMLALKRALSNLIENAALYGKRAQVTLLYVDRAPSIVIEDEGPGIPEDQLDRIFEPFVRLETSRNAETGGSGLGMSIARDIVRRHGGNIGLENRDEGGLRVTVSLPPNTDQHKQGL